eukprot:514924-Prorocentrum_minimum.AAC.1
MYARLPSAGGEGLPPADVQSSYEAVSVNTRDPETGQDSLIWHGPNVCAGVRVVICHLLAVWRVQAPSGPAASAGSGKAAPTPHQPGRS